MHSPVYSSRGTLALMVAATLVGLPSADADVTVSSAPVGYYRIPLSAGYQTVGVGLVRNPTLVSLVDSTSPDTIAITEDGVTIGDLLDENSSYYLEIVEGPTGVEDQHVGHRFEVDIDETIDADDGEMIIDPSAEHTTLDLDPPSDPTPDLTGYRIELREHVLLGEAFDKTVLYASTSLSDADQVQYFDGSKFVVYYLLRNAADTLRAWVESDLVTSAEGVVIPPGVGLIYKRSSSAPVGGELVISGKVRTNPFHQPLKQGFNFVAEPFPVTSNFVERDALYPNFLPDNSASQADQVQVLEGTGFTQYHLFGDPELHAWVPSANPITNENTTDLFDYRHPVFFKMKNGSDGYRVPLTWTP